MIFENGEEKVLEEQKKYRAKESILRSHAEKIIQKTIADVLPDKAVQEAMEKLNLRGRVFVLAVGKAAWVMAEAAGKWLGSRKEAQLEKGLVVTKYGHGKGKIPGTAIMESGHPVPDENSVKAGQEAVRFVQEAGEEDTVLFLLSGGGSALLELPEEGLSLSDIQETTGQLLRCGADITEINLIRKKLSAVKGGKLAGFLKTKKAYSIILSDVIGGSEDMIASGLTYHCGKVWAGAFGACGKRSGAGRGVGERRGQIPEGKRPGGKSCGGKRPGAVPGRCQACRRAGLSSLYPYGLHAGRGEGRGEAAGVSGGQSGL